LSEVLGGAQWQGNIGAICWTRIATSSEATIIECDDDATALLEADRLLASSAQKSVEVWDRSRKVSILSRNTTAA